MRGIVFAGLMVLAAAAAAIAVNAVLLGYTSPHDESVGKLSPAGGILRPSPQPASRIVKHAPRKTRGHHAPPPQQVTATVVVTASPPPPSLPAHPAPHESEHHTADD